MDENEPLPEGARVLIKFFPDDEGVELTPEEEAELIERDAAIDRGEFITFEEAATMLRPRRPPTASHAVVSTATKHPGGTRGVRPARRRRAV